MLEAQLVKCPNGPHGQQVLTCENRRWRARRLHHGDDGALGCIRGVEVEMDEAPKRRLDIRSVRRKIGHGFEESIKAFVRCLDRAQVTEKRDALMAEAAEMGDGMPGPGLVRAHHGIGIEVAWPTVDEHDLKAGSLFDLQIRLIATRGNDDQPIDAPADECGDEFSFALGVLLDRSREDSDVAISGDLLDPAVHRG